MSFEIEAVATAKCFNNGGLVGEGKKTVWRVSDALIEHAVKERKQLSAFIPPHLEILGDIPELTIESDDLDDGNEGYSNEISFIIDAAKKLDPKDDSLWYANGNPKLGAVNEILVESGRAKISKDVLDATCEKTGFTRPKK